MEENRIQLYMRRLKHQLWLRGLDDVDTLAELESHLRESVEFERQRGLSLEEAERQALEHFGSIETITGSFEKERKAVMQKILLVCGLLAGLFLAYLDGLPHWDDSGILAGGLLLGSALPALLGYRRPWLLALAVGLWIPLHDIALKHDLSMLLVLIFPFAGAYIGWAINQVIRKTLRPA